MPLFGPPNVNKLKQKQDIGKLIKALNYDNASVRGAAAKALGEIGDPRAVEPLIAALKDDHSNVRATAANWLGKFGEPAVEQLCAALKDDNEFVRRFSADALGEIGHVRAVDPLCDALKDENKLVRQSSARSLGEIGDPRAVETLIALLKDEDKNVRGISISALIKIGEPAVEPLFTALRDVNEEWRRSADRALGSMRDTRAVKPLIEALIIIGEPAVKPLLTALRDDNEYMRESAARTLGKIGDTRAVEPLIEALKDENKIVRMAALCSLGEIGDARAVEPLYDALKDNNKLVREFSTDALVKIGEPAVELLCAALKDREKPVRELAAKALGDIGDPRAIDPLRNALKDNDEDVRKKLEDALKKLGVKPIEVETQKEKPREETGNARPGPVALGEKLIELFNRRKLDPAGKKILAFAMLYEFEKTAPAVWVGPGPDPLAAPHEGPEVRQTRFYASKIIPGYQPHFIPGHLVVDLDTAVVSRQFKPKERLDAAYINQVLAIMLTPLVADHDLDHCSALSLSGESTALGQTRFAIVVGGKPQKTGVKLLRQYTKPIIPGVVGTYFEYEAGSLEEARAFLATQAIKEMRFYVEVHTPEGGIGKDIEGVYEFDL
jgi:HEAT repeat protein